MQKIRTFIAIPIPLELIKKIEILQKELEKTQADLKIVAPQNLHFTLKFLGPLTPEQINETKKILKEISSQTPPFETKIQNLAPLPSPHYIRVIYLDTSNDQLLQLQKKVESSLQHLRKEARESKTHLTITRVKTPKNKDKLIAFLEKNKDIEIGTFTVNKLILYSSQLTPKGPLYNVLEEFPLG